MEIKQILSVLLPNQYVRFILPSGNLYDYGCVKSYFRKGVSSVEESYTIDFVAIDNGVVEFWLKERSEINDN